MPPPGLVLLAALAIAGAPTAAPPPVASPPSPADALAAARDPFDRMTVPVTVDGQGPFPFVMDTGADRTVLSVELAQRLNLASGEPVRLHDTGGVDLIPTVRVARLGVGARELKDVSAPVLAAHDLGGAGMLGVDSLRGRRIVLDFRRRRMTVEPSRAEAYAPDVIVVRAKSRFGQLVLVDASIARAPIAVILDSGAQNTIGNLALRDLVGAREPRATWFPATVLSVAGRSTSAQLGVIPSVKVGGFTLNGLPIAFADLHTFAEFDLRSQPAMLLGVDVMRHFDRVTVDFGRREVSFRFPAG